MKQWTIVAVAIAVVGVGLAIRPVLAEIHHPDLPSSAVPAKVWDDTDLNGVWGSSGDQLRGATVTDANGLFNAFYMAGPYYNLAVVTGSWNIALNPGKWRITGGLWYNNNVTLPFIGVTTKLYEDTNVDGVIGDAGDHLLDTTMTNGIGDFYFKALDFTPNSPPIGVVVDPTVVPAGLWSYSGQLGAMH